MPFKSMKQERFFHTPTAKKAGITDDEVNEFDQASKGIKLPTVAKVPPMPKDPVPAPFMPGKKSNWHGHQ